MRRCSACSIFYRRQDVFTRKHEFWDGKRFYEYGWNLVKGTQILECCEFAARASDHELSAHIHLETLVPCLFAQHSFLIGCKFAAHM